MSDKVLDRQLVQEFDPLPMTREMIIEYIESLIGRGRSDITVKMYQRYLDELYAFIPGDKLLTADILEKWLDGIAGEGYSANTVNICGSVINGFLDYFVLIRPVMRLHVSQVPKEEQVELTREEYNRILEAAREIGIGQNYLLIKAFGSVGICIRDLPYFTVANCVNGTFLLSGGRKAVVPESLQKEILQYCLEHKLYSGPIFVTKHGNIIDHANINKMMRNTAKKAGVEPGKCTPRTLNRLYCKVREDVKKQMELIYMQAFDEVMGQTG